MKYKTKAIKLTKIITKKKIIIAVKCYQPEFIEDDVQL